MERSRLLLFLSVVIAAEVTAVVAIPLSVQRFKGMWLRVLAVCVCVCTEFC